MLLIACIACIVVLVFAAGPSLWGYRQYAYAIAWHCIHGNHAQVAGYRVTLPLLWWEEKDQLHWETYHLMRACPGLVCFNREIKVSHVVPALESTVTNTDQEELERDRKLISDFSARRHPPSLSTAQTVATLRTKSFTLYCIRTDVSSPGLTQLSMFLCRAPRVPFSFEFSSPTSEKEAESILFTME